ncbi:ribonuclease Z [Tardisphaera saccharovorans]
MVFKKWWRLMAIRIKFLGTASGTPISGLFPASALLEDNGKKLLIDCGEGIQYQLFRSGVGLRGLEAVLITHMHGDHVLGLPGFLMTLSLLRWDGKLVIYGPKELEGFVTFTLKITRSGLDVLERTEFKELDSAGTFSVGDMMVTPFPVRHRIRAFGAVIEERSKPGRFNVDRARKLGIPRGPLWGELQRGRSVAINGVEFKPEQVLGPPRRGAKVVYTGDSAPSDSIIERAQGADCLIHDAAFPKGDEEEAHAFGHSTWGDAVQAARTAGVRSLILFNFGGKAVSNISKIGSEARKEFQETYVANDLWECVVKAEETPSLRSDG